MNTLQTLHDERIEFDRRKRAGRIGGRALQGDELGSQQVRQTQCIELAVVVVVDQRRFAAANGARHDALESDLQRQSACVRERARAQIERANKRAPTRLRVLGLAAGSVANDFNDVARTQAGRRR